MIDKEWIEDFIEKQTKIKDRNFRNFQDSGESRYDRASRRAEELIELAEMALSISDTRQKCTTYRSVIAECGVKAMDILHYGIESDIEKTEGLLKTLKTYAEMLHIAEDKWA